jgi:hypothetical protein
VGHPGVQMGGPGGPVGGSESDPALWGPVDVAASLVDHYLVVEPAENDEIFGVGLPALSPAVDMVDLETVT